MIGLVHGILIVSAAFFFVFALMDVLTRASPRSEPASTSTKFTVKLGTNALNLATAIAAHGLETR
jgi:hypothetical protein